MFFCAFLPSHTCPPPPFSLIDPKLFGCEEHQCSSALWRHRLLANVSTFSPNEPRTSLAACFVFSFFIYNSPHPHVVRLYIVPSLLNCFLLRAFYGFCHHQAAQKPSLITTSALFMVLLVASCLLHKKEKVFQVLIEQVLVISACHLYTIILNLLIISFFIWAESVEHFLSVVFILSLSR